VGYRKQQGGFADTWFTRDENNLPGDQTTTEHSIEFADPGGRSRHSSTGDLADATSGFNGLGLARFNADGGGIRGNFNDGAEFTTFIASPYPAKGRRTTAGAFIPCC
jgi:hypothetical protein